MKDLKLIAELTNKECVTISGGNISLTPKPITWPIIVPFGDPSDWDPGVPSM